MKAIDLRSDTVTRPTEAMLTAMTTAPVGDDVYGEDPTVNELEELVAGIVGKERGLFVPTGVMSNQLCLKSLTNPGDEVIVGKESHIFNYETGAPALLSGIQLNTIQEEGGNLTADQIREAIREEVYYLPHTSVIALENSHNRQGGKLLREGVVRSISEVAEEFSIPLHLDGARIWNAVVASGRTAATLSAPFTTVSVCLSKGLGAPIGSVMCGPRDLVKIAHKFRKVWGGGWRQAGILAAAGIYALHNNIDRLAEDHENARTFAALLGESDAIDVLNTPETNIVLLAVPAIHPERFTALAAEQGVLLSAAFKGKMRAVFHMDVSAEETRRAADIVRTLAQQ